MTPLRQRMLNAMVLRGFAGFVALASQGQNLGEFFKRALAPSALMLPVHKTAWRTKVPFLFRCSFGLCGSCASAQCPPGLRWQF